MTDLNSDDSLENAYFGPSAIVGALYTDEPEMLEAVILAGGDVNAELEYGGTPMHTAMELAIDGMLQNNKESPYPKALEMIRILVSHGADVEKKDWEGKTPLDCLNTYSGSEQAFNSLVNMFKDVIPSLEERIQYQKQII